MNYWIDTVNQNEENGIWRFAVSYNSNSLEDLIDKVLKEDIRFFTKPLCLCKEWTLLCTSSILDSKPSQE